ncbi:MAG: hypothetical protein ACYDAK_06655 [Candidatus Limnocylindrales bacterium]
MVASEFAFLVLGLILGIPSGAAILVVIRARPQTPHEVRLIVAPDSVPRRRPSTLAHDPFSAREPAIATAGPADVAWHGGPPVPVAGANGRTIVRPSVAVPVAVGLDPVLATIRRGAPIAASRAVARREPGGTASATGIATLETGIAAGSLERASASSGSRPIDDAPTGTQASAPSATSATSAARCSDERRTVDERCALADRLAAGAEAAAVTLRTARREYDDHAARADSAAAIADVRSQRAAKDAAQAAFREARAGASTHDLVEGAARAWLQEINRINTTAREASSEMTLERAAAVALIGTIERLTVEADAARVQAEAAQTACLEARDALAACEEQAATASSPFQPSLAPDEPPVPEAAPITAAAIAAGVVTRPDEAVLGGSLVTAAIAGGSRVGSATILRLLSGDRSALDRIAANLSAGDPLEERRWQLALSELVDAIVGRAIEACSFVFPDAHPFWGLFPPAQSHDIALALSSLGFRTDRSGSFIDDRAPGQRELSLALGYAGIDPMRIRHWPTEAELPLLYRDVIVAAGEYLVATAPGLTLGELVAVLGRQADALTDLWNAWGTIRPLLIEPV